MGARPANRRDYKVAFLKSAHIGPHFHYFAERFVPNHQIIKTFGRRAIDEMANLLVRSTNPHFKRFNPHLALRGNPWSNMFHQADLPLERKNTHSSHLVIHQKPGTASGSATRGPQVSVFQPGENKNFSRNRPPEAQKIILPRIWSLFTLQKRDAARLS